MPKLSPESINLELEKLPGWSYQEDNLLKEFEFDNFSSALAFIVQTGILAEKIDHHPDILLHSYNKVLIKCTTHSEGGITEKDIELSKLINGVF